MFSFCWWHSRIAAPLPLVKTTRMEIIGAKLSEINRHTFTGFMRSSHRSQPRQLLCLLQQTCSLSDYRSNTSKMWKISRLQTGTSYRLCIAFFRPFTKKKKKKKEVANFLTAMHFSSVLVTFSPPSESRDLKTLQQNLTVHFHASSQIKIWLHISRQTCSEKSGTTYLCGWKTCPLATPRKIAPQESQGTRQTVHFLKAACVTIFHYVFLLVGPF